MATINRDLTFNVAHGRVASFFKKEVTGYNTGALVVYAITDSESTTGTSPTLIAKTDAVREAATWAAVKAVQGQATALPKTTLQNVTVTVDSANDQVLIDCDDWSYPNATAGQKTGALIMCAEPNSGVSDATTIPLLAFKYEETTTGSTLNILVPTGGFFAAADVPA